MFEQGTGLRTPQTAVLAGTAVLGIIALGALTGLAVAGPLLFVCLLATGLFFFSGTNISSIDRLVLVPAVGLSTMAVSSLLIPLTAVIGLVDTPVHEPAVTATAAALPPLAAIGYWATRAEPKLPRVQITPRLLIPGLPAVLGAVGALTQWQFDIVVQNYVITALLIVLGPTLLYWSQTEFESALSLYGLASGVLLSHTLVTGYSVGVDIQMSLHTIDQITTSGTWPVNNVFFIPGADDASIGELRKYLGPTLSHTMLPVIVGVPTLFERVGNMPPDAVFDILYVSIFALTPVMIFRLARLRLTVREAFVAGMLAIVYYRFFHTSPGKQHMAQFFVGALLIVWHTDLDNRRRRIATVLGAVGIVFAHYAVTFLFLAFVIGAYVIAQWYRKVTFRSGLSSMFVGFFYSVVMLWYIVITGGEKPITAISAIFASINRVLGASGPQHRTGADVASEQTVLIDQVNLGLHMLLFGAIFLGILFVIYYGLRTREPVFSNELDSLSIWFFGLLGLSVVVSGHLGIDRALDIALVVVAPVAVLGVRESLDLIGAQSSLPDLGSHTYKIGLLFVVLMLSLSSGLVYEASGESATSAINLHEEPNSVMFTGPEYRAAQWIIDNRNNSTVYVGQYATVPFQRIDGRSPEYLQRYRGWEGEINVTHNETSYVFLRKAEITNESYRLSPPAYQITRSEYRRLSERTTVVFENRDSIVLRTRPEARTNATEQRVIRHP